MLNDQINYVFKTTGLDILSSQDFSKEVKSLLNLSGEDITGMTDKKLSETIFNGSKYINYLQLYYNQANAEYINLKKIHEIELLKAVHELDSKKTIKEKTSYVLDINLGLKKQNEDLNSLEVTVNLLNNMPERITELVNALKKELQLRQTKRSMNI